MKKKNLSIMRFASLSMALLGVMTSCNTTNKPVHEHVYKDVDAIEETCITDGMIAHKECIYCGKLFVDGKEVDEKDVIIAKNDNKHVKTLIEEIPALQHIISAIFVINYLLMIKKLPKKI